MQTISLSINQKTVIPVLCVKQGDVGRKFKAVITKGSEQYQIPADTIFSIWYSGASGEGNYTHIGDSSAISVDGNAVTVELITQMLTNAGEGLLCLVMSGTDGSQLGTWNIPYMVEPVPGMGSVAAEQYYTAFTENVQKVQEVVEKVANLGRPGKGERAVTFNDPENKAISKDTFAGGRGCLAGLKGFYWSQIDVASKTITLSTVNLPENAEDPIWGVAQDFDIADYWAVGDAITIQTEPNIWTDCSVIQELSGNTVIVDTLPFTQADPWNGMPIGQMVYVTAKPENGLVDLGTQAFAFGNGSKATNFCATAIGFRNHAYEPYGVVAGRENIGTYCATVIGKNNVVTGHSSVGLGQTNVVTGEKAVALGYSNEISGEYGQAVGYKNKVTGLTSFAAGSSNVVDGKNAAAIGYKNEVPCEYGQAIGYKNKVTGLLGFAAGTSNVVAGTRAAAIGNYLLASSKNQVVEGCYNAEDAEDEYLYILGNGTSHTNRSNAHTIDKNGDAWFAGKVSAKNIPVEDTTCPGCYYRTVDGNIEWINPPMVPGVEYRTTERHNGEAVYTKLINFGAAATGTNSFEMSDNVIRWNAIGRDEFFVVYQAPDADSGFCVTVDMTFGSCDIECTVDLYDVKIQLWYCKN